MIRFLKQLNTYQNEFKVTKMDWVNMVVHYPLFLSHVQSKNKSSMLGKVCTQFNQLFKGHRIETSSRLRGDGPYKIPIEFDEFGLTNFREIFLGGEYRIPQLTSEITSYVDAGANTGMASIYFALKFPIEKMALVEANQELIPSLEKNIVHNFQKMDIQLFNNCVSHKSDQDIHFYVSDNHRDSSAVNGSGRKVSVKTITLKDAVNSLGLKEVDLLKIDIEGSEHQIMANDPKSFQLFKNIIAEVHGNKQECQAFISQLQSLGFETRILADHTENYSCLNLIAHRTS